VFCFLVSALAGSDSTVSSNGISGISNSASNTALNSETKTALYSAVRLLDPNVIKVMG